MLERLERAAAEAAGSTAFHHMQVSREMQAEFGAFWEAHAATPLAARDVLLSSACPQAMAAAPTPHHPPLTLSLVLALALAPVLTLTLALPLRSSAACTW